MKESSAKVGLQRSQGPLRTFAEVASPGETFVATTARFSDSLPPVPRHRNDSNPLEAKRRLLEQQERLLAQKRRELREQLESRGAPEAAAAARADEPPVWRMEDDPNDYDTEPARFRHLARQRRRDMIVFFGCIVLLLAVIAVLLWIICAHAAAPTPGA